MDSLPALDEWQRLIRIGVLHGAGRLDEAERCCNELLDPRRGEPKHPELVVRTLLLRAALNYDKGAFRSFWVSIRDAVSVNFVGLPPLLQAAVETCKCLLDVASANVALRKLEALHRDSQLNRREQDQIELSRVETLVSLAGRSEGFRVPAEVAAREALARARARGELARGRSPVPVEDQLRRDSDGLAEARAAYLALLADDDDIAREIFRTTSERTDNWRIMALRATTAVRTLQPRVALRLNQEVLQRRRHDIERRCSLVQAALLADEIAVATREAAGIVRLAPDHVLGRLLHAESLYLAAGTPSNEGGSEDYQQLIYACNEYAQTIRLHYGLETFLSNWEATAGPVGSELLSDEVFVHAARQCVHAGVRACHALARARLPLDQTVLDSANFALRRLHWLDPPGEAARLESLLNRPQKDNRRRWRALILFPLAGLGIACLALTDWWLIQRLVEGGVPRAALIGLAVVVAIFPLVRKITLFGVEVERGAAVDLLGTSTDILQGGIASTRRRLTRLMSPVTPPIAVPAVSAKSDENPPPQGTSGPEDAERGRRADPIEPRGTGGANTRRAGADALAVLEHRTELTAPNAVSGVPRVT